MERLVIHRDRQELQAADLNNMQDFARATIDRLTSDGVGEGQFFTGFSPQETGTYEITLGPGRLYSSGGMYREVASTVHDLFNLRPISQTTIVAITAFGQNLETDVQPRDVLIDPDNGTTEPQPVAMETLRKAAIGVIPGAEDAAPQPPAIPANNVLLALVTLSTSGIASVSYQTQNLLPQAHRNKVGLDAVEAWRAEIENALTTFRSDMAALAGALGTKADRSRVDYHANRLAALEAGVSTISEDFRNHQAEVAATSIFLAANVELYSSTTKSDTDHVDYDARVSGGLHFPFTASDTPAGGLQLLNPADPKVRIVDDILKPVATSETTLSVRGNEAGQAGLTAYSSTTTRSVAHTGTRSISQAGLNDVVIRTVPRNGAPTVLAVGGQPYNATNTQSSPKGSDWVEVVYRGTTAPTTTTETYTYYTQETDTVNHTAHGRSQGFMTSRGGWVNEARLWFHTLDANQGATIILCEADDSGVPKMARTLGRVTVTYETLIAKNADGSSSITLPPVYLSAGQRFSLVILSEGAHKLSLVSGTRNLSQGQHHALTAADTWTAPGDQAQHDIEMELAFDRYEDTSVTIDLQPLQLSGGVTNLVLQTPLLTPANTSVRFELQAAGAWYELWPGQSIDGYDWSQSAPIIPLRVTLIGTNDVMPSIGIGAKSEFTVGRMATAMTHISELIDAGSPASKIRVKTRLENFDEANHDCTISLLVGGAPVVATSTADTVLDDDSIQRTAVFDMGVSPTQTFAVKTEGTALSNVSTFMISERLDYAAV